MTDQSASRYSDEDLLRIYLKARDSKEGLRSVFNAALSERGTSEPFVHAFSIKRGKEDGWWYLHGEQLVPGLNLAHTDLQTVLDDLLPAWRKLHEVAPQQVPAPPMGLSEINQNRMAIETVLGLLLERRSVVQNAIEKIQAVLPIVQENRPGERNSADG